MHCERQEVRIYWQLTNVRREGFNASRGYASWEDALREGRLYLNIRTLLPVLQTN